MPKAVHTVDNTGEERELYLLIILKTKSSSSNSCLPPSESQCLHPTWLQEDEVGLTPHQFQIGSSLTHEVFISLLLPSRHLH